MLFETLELFTLECLFWWKLNWRKYRQDLLWNFFEYFWRFFCAVLLLFFCCFQYSQGSFCRQCFCVLCCFFLSFSFSSHFFFVFSQLKNVQISYNCTVQKICNVLKKGNWQCEEWKRRRRRRGGSRGGKRECKRKCFV